MVQPPVLASMPKVRSSFCSRKLTPFLVLRASIHQAKSALTASSTRADLCGRDEAKRLAASNLVVRSLPDLITEAAWRRRPQSEDNSFSETTDLDFQLLSVSRSLERFFSGKEIVLFSKSKIKPRAVHLEVGGTT